MVEQTFDLPIFHRKQFKQFMQQIFTFSSFSFSAVEMKLFPSLFSPLAFSLSAKSASEVSLVLVAISSGE